MTELESVKAECERLRKLLDAHGIDWRPKAARSVLSLQEKVELFRSLFVGREDVFARRWVSTASGKSGYQPVCSNEWSSVCNKKTFKCADCPNRAFQSIGYNDLYRHLEGKDILGRDVLGTYSILPDHTCRFLCADFDDKSCEHGYQSDVSAYVGVCKKWGIHAYIERSRSGNGAHVWILFEGPVKAKDARRLGNAILTEAMDNDARLSFKSYDRFFPNQDFMPEGGFGNLVALPLQGAARRKGNSVFVNEEFNPIEDQWAFLRSIEKVTSAMLQSVLGIRANATPLGELSTSTEAVPWERPKPKLLSPSEFPPSIRIILANGIYVPIRGVPSRALNHLKRLAAFRNPEFYAKQAMRLPTFNLPRIVSCSDMTFLAMPVSWKGLIAQYAGRLHRDYPGKKDVRIYDYVDLYVPVCEGMYQKRLNGYKAIGYSISKVEDNLFSEIKTELIYDADTYGRSYQADLAKAKKIVMIACRKLIWKRPPKVLELLNTLTLRGVEVMVAVSETGYSEKDIENFGITLRYSMHPNPNSVIIDSNKVWYGSINFIGRSVADATAIRLVDSSLAHDMLSSILKGIG